MSLFPKKGLSQRPADDFAAAEDAGQAGQQAPAAIDAAADADGTTSTGTMPTARPTSSGCVARAGQSRARRPESRPFAPRSRRRRGRGHLARQPRHLVYGRERFPGSGGALVRLSASGFAAFQRSTPRGSSAVASRYGAIASRVLRTPSVTVGPSLENGAHPARSPTSSSSSSKTVAPVAFASPSRSLRARRVRPVLRLGQPAVEHALVPRPELHEDDAHPGRPPPRRAPAARR